MLGSGYFRGSKTYIKYQEHKALVGQFVEVKVTAREDAVYSKRHQLTFSADNLELVKPTSKLLIGNMEIEGRGVLMVYKGDRLKIKGKLYSRRGENVSGISFADIVLIKSSNSKIDNIRRHFGVGLQNVLPEPLASLGMGILIGQRNTLPDDFNEQLRRVGLIHIVAVSGYNLTILIYFSQRFLKKRSRYQSLIVSIILIILFLLITGFSPSIVRASVVSVISLIMWFYGRDIRPLMILLLSAVITAGWNPLYIWFSVGWYLSFMAFFGILILAPLLHQRFIPRRFKESILAQVLAETTSAQICTLPILIFVFSSVSLVSIVANLLVVPITPFVMLATVFAGVYGMFGQFLFGGLLVLPAKIMLGYMVEVTKVLSNVPNATVDIKMNITQTLLLVLLIVTFTYILSRSTRAKVDIYNG